MLIKIFDNFYVFITTFIIFFTWQKFCKCCTPLWLHLLPPTTTGLSFHRNWQIITPQICWAWTSNDSFTLLYLWAPWLLYPKIFLPLKNHYGASQSSSFSLQHICFQDTQQTCDIHVIEIDPCHQCQAPFIPSSPVGLQMTP